MSKIELDFTSLSDEELGVIHSGAQRETLRRYQKSLDDRVFLTLTCEEIIFIKNNELVRAIKSYRERNHVGLKEALDVCQNQENMIKEMKKLEAPVPPRDPDIERKLAP